MSIKRENFTVEKIEINVERKRVKNITLSVYPPQEDERVRVRLLAPHRVGIEQLHVFVRSKLPWLKRKIQFFQKQDRHYDPPKEYVSGEIHYLQGEGFSLEVVESDDCKSLKRVEIQENKIILHAKSEYTQEMRERILREWYRKRLKEILPALIAHWESVIGVKTNDWGVKQMKTRWGTCNTQAKRIWLNLELIKKSPECLEYVVVHELVHLLERSHNHRFVGFMDQFMPHWRVIKKELNQSSNPNNSQSSVNP